MATATSAINNEQEQELTRQQAPVQLPPGYYVELPTRGKMFFRECPQQDGRPTVLLIHGMMASSGLNWYQVFAPLSEHFNVIAIDLRGHGRSMRKQRSRFTLRKCADDIAAFIDALHLDRPIVVGYSMGGAIAQHFARKYPEKLGGLVLSGTGCGYRVGLRERAVIGPMFAALIGVSRLSEIFSHLPNRVIAELFPGVKVDEYMSIRQWVADELRRNKARVVIESASEMAKHRSKPWLKDIEAPTAVLVTLRDSTFSAQHQIEMALQIPEAEILRYDGGHNAPSNIAFGHALAHACDNVTGRMTL